MSRSFAAQLGLNSLVHSVQQKNLLLLVLSNEGEKDLNVAGSVDIHKACRSVFLVLLSQVWAVLNPLDRRDHLRRVVQSDASTVYLDS